MLQIILFSAFLFISYCGFCQPYYSGYVNSDSQTTNNSDQKYIKSLKDLKLKSDSINDYLTVKRSVSLIRNKLLSDTLVISTDSLSRIFKNLLLNRVIPYWEGTKWSFEGHTSVPPKGEIACGYFISTTLKDVGVYVNRYKLAQQSPINEALSIAIDSQVVTVNEGTLESNIKFINDTIKEGIYFIGFDQSHVGYVLKEKGELFLIHSNYMEPCAVCIEKIEESEVFKDYEKYYLAEISTNKKLLQYWLKGNELKIVTGIQ